MKIIKFLHKTLLITTTLFKKMYKNSLIITIISGMIIILYRKSFICNKTNLYYKQTQKNKKIYENMRPYNYSPAFLMPYPIIQMLLHESMTPKKSNFKREYITSSDGGQYSLDWVVENPKDFFDKKDKKIMLILHGLTGGSQTIYIRDIIEEYKQLKGFKICVLHSRGINDTPLKTPISYHVSFTKDLDHCLKMFKKRFPEMPIYTTGVSMGANILTKYLSNEYNMGDYVKCFISISNPFDFHALKENVQNSFLPYFLKKNISSYLQLNSILRNNEGKRFLIF